MSAIYFRHDDSDLKVSCLLTRKASRHCVRESDDNDSDHAAAAVGMARFVAVAAASIVFHGTLTPRRSLY